jgi:hypothetical protein
MKDPVLAADGYTYERTAIETWLSSHDTSPVTNAMLPNTTVSHSAATPQRGSITGLAGEHTGDSTLPSDFPMTTVGPLHTLSEALQTPPSCAAVLPVVAAVDPQPYWQQPSRSTCATLDEQGLATC